VQYTYRGAYLNALSEVIVAAMSPESVYLWTLPMFHCNGWCYPWTVAERAGTSVCLRRVEAKAALDAIREHRVTHMCGAPIVYSMLINAPEELRREIDHQIAGQIAGAAPPAAIIEGADRVANTAGVYASYMKRWQPNSKRRFEITPEKPIKGPPAIAHLMDAADAAKEVGEVDLIYIDPPYNSRQYVAYYHIPEILARGWTDSAPLIRGKVGLLAGAEGRSLWSHGRRVKKLFSALLAATGARHALISFNSEGHLAPEALSSLLTVASVDGEVAHYSQSYRRYRADSERTGRHYHRNLAVEHLFLIRLR
jgi:hypothetical protein